MCAQSWPLVGFSKSRALSSQLGISQNCLSLDMGMLEVTGEEVGIEIYGTKGVRTQKPHSSGNKPLSTDHTILCHEMQGMKLKIYTKIQHSPL